MSQQQSEQRTTRRTFLTAILAACAAPAIAFARAEPKAHHVLYGDGIHDDTEALQAMLNGEQVEMPHRGIPGTPEPPALYRVTNTLYVRNGGHAHGLHLVGDLGNKPYLRFPTFQGNVRLTDCSFRGTDGSRHERT